MLSALRRSNRDYSMALHFLRGQCSQSLSNEEVIESERFLRFQIGRAVASEILFCCPRTIYCTSIRRSALFCRPNRRMAISSMPKVRDRRTLTLINLEFGSRRTARRESQTLLESKLMTGGEPLWGPRIHYYFANSWCPSIVTIPQTARL